MAKLTAIKMDVGYTRCVNLWRLQQPTIVTNKRCLEGFPSKIINTPPKVVFDDNRGQPREARGGHTRNKQTRADWLEQLRDGQKCTAQAV